jgi:hypothetical protein
VPLARRFTTCLLATLLVAAAFLALFQTRLYGDYVGLSAAHVEWSEQRHWLYFALRAVLRSFAIPDGFALKLLSSVPMALGLWICVGSIRRAHSDPRETHTRSFDVGAIALLLLAPPVCVFFGTTIELHGLHLLGAALAFAGAQRAARASGAVRGMWLGAALATPFAFHPLLLLQAPALVAVAWRRQPKARLVLALLAAAAVLSLPLLALALPAEPDAAWPARAKDLWHALKFAFRGTAEGMLPGPSDVALHAWRELASPLGVLALALPLELALRFRERSEWQAPALALGMHAALLPLLGVREFGAYGLGLVPFALEAAHSLHARASESRRERAPEGLRSSTVIALLAALPPTVLVLVPIGAQAFASARRIASYASIGDDRAWIERCVGAIAASGTPRERAYVMTQCSPRWELLSRDHGISGCDLRFAADEVPARRRAELARRIAESARLQALSGFTLYLDRAATEPYPGNEALPEFIAALRERAEFVALGGDAGPVLRLVFRAGPEAR